jgi:hypothetical protein
MTDAITTATLTASDGTRFSGATLAARGRTADVWRADVDGRTWALWIARRDDDAPSSLADTALAVASDDDEAFAARVVDVSTVDGARRAVVYPWADGETLSTWAAPGRTRSDAEVLAVGRGLAAAVARLNAAGFVHRCTSPDHVIVAADLSVRLAGWMSTSRVGEAAKRRPTGDSRYIAPEVRHDLGGRLATVRSDVWGLGAAFAYASTGVDVHGEVEQPLDAVACAALRRRHEGFSLFVAKCLQPLQKQRFSSSARAGRWLNADALPAAQVRDDDGAFVFGPLLLLAPWFAAPKPEAAAKGREAARPPQPDVGSASAAPRSTPAAAAAAVQSAPRLARMPRPADTDEHVPPAAGTPRRLGLWRAGMSAIVLTLAIWATLRALGETAPAVDAEPPLPVPAAAP